jgi:hypothetical protein
MNSKSKFAAIAILTTVGVATPAFAQELETGTAANREQLFGTSPNVTHYGRQAYRANGLSAYAKVPRRGFVTRPGPAYGWGGY